MSIALLRMVLVGACVALSGAGYGGAQAERLLRVEGSTVKWFAPRPGQTTVITYVVLTNSYSLPREKRRLSPDNCGVMGPFTEITSASPEITPDISKRELKAALTAWETAAGVAFVEVSEIALANITIGAAESPTGRAFANLVVGGTYGTRPVAKAFGATSQIESDSSSIAEAASTPSEMPIEQAYVCLNPKLRWKSAYDGNLTVYDLRHTFMHEIGHAIGLDHPGSSGSIMSYRYEEQMRDLQSADIAAAQSLYGPPKSP